MEESYIVTWVFRNDHSWSKRFKHEQDATGFMHTTGLQTHPDIVYIKIEVDTIEKRSIMVEIGQRPENSV